MAEAEKSIYGRKVFFINPGISFEAAVIDRLRLMEYEVYAVADYRKVKHLLRKNADSICFFLIENQLTLKGWHNFIKSFEEESVFTPLDMGILLPALPEDKLSNFLSELNFTAGKINLKQDPENMFHEIVKAFDACQAKGLRKYVRANCLNESADLLWLKDNRMVRLKIIDISSVGLAAKMSLGQANAVFINQMISDVTLNLRNIQVSVDIKISAIKDGGDFLLVVIMFTPETVPDSINKIRHYIAENLQFSIQTQVKSFDLDRIDYEKLY